MSDAPKSLDAPAPAPTDEESQSFATRMTAWLKGVATRRPREEDLHEALVELIEDKTDPLDTNTPEYQLLQNIVALKERTVDDCMTPRADICAVDANTPMNDIIAYMVQEAHSRYPVYRDDLDNTVGMIILKDAVMAMAAGSMPAIDDLLRDVPFVPTSMPAMRLLVQMRQKRQHMAMVVDEYGGIDGIITIEDLIEQVVGDIEDEHDEDGFVATTVKADGSLLVDGRMPLGLLEEQIGQFLTDAERDGFDTVNGLILSLADRVPARGTKLAHGSGVTFEVTDADARRIKRVKVRAAAGQSIPETRKAGA